MSNRTQSRDPLIIWLVLFSLTLILPDPVVRASLVASSPQVLPLAFQIRLPIASKYLPSQESIGIFDPDFGTDGLVVTDIAGGSDYPADLAIQPDGKILVSGEYYNGQNYYFALLRYNPDGSLDTSFGYGGIVTTNFGHDAYGGTLTLQPDGKIILAGFSFDATIDSQVIMARYNTDGTLDASFGEAGLVRVTRLDHDYFGYDLAIQDDGKILVAGALYGALDYDIAVWRFNPDGSLDATFDGDGLASMDVDGNDFGSGGVVVQPDGRIVVAGWTSYSVDIHDILLVRYTPNGLLDPSLDGDGVVVTEFGYFAEARDVLVQPDGKILLVGAADQDFVLARFNPDGIPDMSFGEYGWVVTDFFGNPNWASSVELQWNGKIVVGGSDETDGNHDLALARYNPDGSLDLSFGNNGWLTTDIGGAYNGLSAVLVQPDGKLLATGLIYNGVDYDIALVRYK